MNIIADGGSTKVEWLLKKGDEIVARYTSRGMNPSLQGDGEIMHELVMLTRSCPEFAEATSVEYYGAGCTAAASPRMEACLHSVFPLAKDITVGSDIIGAAKALLGDTEGIACILGTGANSCLWDGRQIVRQTPSLGFILGDEGSGAVLGKLFLNALYKGKLPSALREMLEKEYAVDMMGVIERVYRQPQPNRWLASLSPFIKRYIHVPEVDNIVCDNLEAFITRNIVPYYRPDLPVSFVGSIAFYYEDQLRKVAEKHGVRIGKIIKSPL